MSVPKHYTLKKDHPHSYEMHDARDDKSFHVAKKGLTLDMLGKLSEVKQYAGGGEAEEPDMKDQLKSKMMGMLPTLAGAAMGEPIPPMADGGEVEETELPQIERTRAEKSGDIQPLETLKKALEEGSSEKSFQESMASLPKTPEEAAAQGIPPLQGPKIASLDPNAGIEQLERTPAMAAPDSLTPAKPLANEGTPYDTALTAAPSVLPKAPDVITEQINAQDQAAQKYRNTIDSFVKAKAEQGKGTEQAWSAYEEGLKTLKSPQEYSKELATLDAEWQKQMLDPKNNNRDYFSTRSTPQKLAIGIGVILGGLGASKRGGKNPGLEMLNQAIDRDMQGQKDKQSQTMSLWKMNRERVRNDYEADITTRSQLLEIAKAELQKGAAKIMAPEAQMNAAGALKTIDDELAKNRMMRTLMAQGNKTQVGSEAEYLQNQKIKGMIDPKSTEHDGDMYIPNVGIARNKVPEKTREQLIGLNNMKDVLNRNKEFAQAMASDVLGTLPKSTRNTRSAFLQQQLLYGFKDMVKLGVLSDDEYARVAKIIPPPGQMNTGAALAAYEELGRSLGDTEKNYLMSAGVTPFNKPPTANMHRQLFEQNINSTDPLKRQQATELGRIHGWVKQ